MSIENYLTSLKIANDTEKQAQLLSAMESAKDSINYKMKKEYTLRDKYFPFVESYLPKTEHLLFRHIAKYEDKYSYIINSPYPLKNLNFGMNETGEDYDIVFRCCNIDQAELRADMKKVPLPGNLTEKAAFVPISVVLYFIIRYYIFTNQPKKAEIIYPYYGYSIYWKRFSKSFKRFPPVERVMIYTINAMSKRPLIKKLGSIRALLFHIVDHIFSYYTEGLADSCDEGIRYILDQVQSDIGSKMNSIAEAYYDNYYSGKEIMNSSTFIDDDGSQRVDTSISSTVEVLSQNYTNKFFSESINISRVKMAVSMTTDASYKELERTLNHIQSSIPNNDVQNFYSAIFLYYLTLDNPDATESSVRSMKFVALMRDVIKKGTSSNKNIMTIINYTNQWLEAGSNTFRLTNRDGTKSNYRKAVYNYFILNVVSK